MTLRGQSDSPERRQSEPRPPQGHSFIVSKYGLDGVREHYMPGNRRRGTDVRVKRAFERESDALTFLAEKGWSRNSVYKCTVCGAWHTASPGRDGDPER